jgi:hypothetical protein
MKLKTHGSIKKMTNRLFSLRDPKKKLVYPANWNQVLPKEVLKRA